METRTTIIQNKLKKNKKKNKNNEKENAKEIILKPKRTVKWTEDTIDNENMGKLKSNICCIYNPSREVRENGNYSDSPDTCSSDDNNELERSKQTKKEHLINCSKKNKNKLN